MLPFGSQSCIRVVRSRQGKSFFLSNREPLPLFRPVPKHGEHTDGTTLSAMPCLHAGKIRSYHEIYRGYTQAPPA